MNSRSEEVSIITAQPACPQQQVRTPFMMPCPPLKIDSTQAANFQRKLALRLKAALCWISAIPLSDFLFLVCVFNSFNLFIYPLLYEAMSETEVKKKSNFFLGFLFWIWSWISILSQTHTIKLLRRKESFKYAEKENRQKKINFGSKS